MSGICGLFSLDKAPVAEDDIQAMSAMLGRRGPDRTGVYCDGSIALAHMLLATTPESGFEQQPLEHRESGCVVSADVRLDNRTELLGKLGLHARQSTIGDAELLLLAYLEWGEQCLAHVLGDFAFAVWDPRQKSLFCARDHFGMRPLYYHEQPGKHFFFASEPRAILVLPQVPYRLNRGRIADFLVPSLQWIDYTSTFFDGDISLATGTQDRRYTRAICIDGILASCAGAGDSCTL